VKPLIVPFFISHRGCPHQCVFCDQVKIAGSGGEFPTEAEMLDKIAAYRRSGRRSSVEVAFYGGTFTALPSAVQEKLLHPLGPLIAAGEVESIRVSTRPDAVNDKTARFLKGMGVKAVELGVQSMADDVLALSGRGHTAADVDRACSILREAGIAVGVQLMPGLPGDTPEKSLDSFMRVVALRPDFLRVYPTLVIAGTPLATLYENGSYQPLDLDAAVRLCKIMLHRAWQAGIPMIRMGLQPTAELETAGTVLSGPYHPAFRYLVEAELCFDLLVRMTRGIAPGSQLEVSCAPAMVSSLVGHRRGNVERLGRLYGLMLSGVRGDPALSPFEMIVERAGEVRRGDLIADLDYA
jgi:histone acetyltransferase (RNA polymerase elongator complex component)